MNAVADALKEIDGTLAPIDTHLAVFLAPIRLHTIAHAGFTRHPPFKLVVRRLVSLRSLLVRSQTRDESGSINVQR
jgi:hypothetical protein